LFFIIEQGEACIRKEDILELLKQQGQSIALVLIGAVQFYTGQLFDVKTITHAAQESVRKFCFFEISKFWFIRDVSLVGI
jgi:kynureninase